MIKARLMDQPEDFEKLGVNPNRIEPWEDGRRNQPTGAGNWEWWYFDSIMDDGRQVVVQFLTRSGLKMMKGTKDAPAIKVTITDADGTEHATTINVPLRDCTYGKDKCDVHFGANSFVGDFANYTIKTEEHDGLAVDLHLRSTSKPYRPGTAYFEFGDKYFTWLCGVPAGEVAGTIKVKGLEVKVHGTGYHDHQWGNGTYWTLWNHWVWARQAFDDYTLLVFDFVTAGDYGYERVPIAFVQDKAGNLVFESHDQVDCEVLDTFVEDQASDKEYPAHLHYVFHDGDKTLEYDLKQTQILDRVGMKSMPMVARMIVKKMKMDVSYCRFLADGKLTLTGPVGEVKRDGELIFEFMYPGTDFKAHM